MALKTCRLTPGSSRSVGPSVTPAFPTKRHRRPSPSGSRSFCSVSRFSGSSFTPIDELFARVHPEDVERVRTAAMDALTGKTDRYVHLYKVK